MQSFSDVEVNGPGAPEWERLQGQVIESAYEIWEFLRTDLERAIFRATPLRRTRAVNEDTSVDYFVMLEHAEEPGAEVRLKRYLEASFLRDVNLLRVYHAGRAHLAGNDYIYVVTERADFSLRDLERDSVHAGASLMEGLAELTQHVVDGLAQLHGENLVYCALRSESVWRVGSQWKLADYSQLRVSGQHEEYGASLSDLDLAHRPPEAAFGEVSPAWDVWALGLLLKSLAHGTSRNLTATMTAGTTPGTTAGITAGANGQSSESPATLPEPFAGIVAGALIADPAERIDLGRISFKLNNIERRGGEEKSSAPEKSNAPVVDVPPPAAPVPASSLPSPTGSGTGLVGYALLSRAELEARRRAKDYDEEPPRRNTVWRAFLIAFLIAAIPAAGYYTWTTWATEIRSALHLPPAARPASGSVEGSSAVPAGTEGAVETVVPADPSSASGSATASAVLNLLDHWKDATRAHNLDQIMICYAPRVDLYFNRRDLTTDDLRKVKEEELTTSAARNGFDLLHLRFLTVTPERVVVAFDKTVYAARRRPAITHEQVMLSKIDGIWKISSEVRF